MNKSQRKATVMGRIIGMALSVYFWFILNNHGNDHPVHQSIFAAALEDHRMDTQSVIITVVLSTLIVTIFLGLVSRLLFSFKDDE